MEEQKGKVAGLIESFKKEFENYKTMLEPIMKDEKEKFDKVAEAVKNLTGQEEIEVNKMFNDFTEFANCETKNFE